MRLTSPIRAALGIAALLFFGCFSGCSDNDEGRNFSYLRSASDFGIDTAGNELCDEPQPAFGNDAALCRAARKFKLHWERPEDTAGFRGYRIFVDTLQGSRKWDDLRGRDELASILVLDGSRSHDTLTFFLTSKDGAFKPDTVLSGRRPIVAIDSTGRVDSLGRFVFALVTRYSDAKATGQPDYHPLITNDRFPPLPFVRAFTMGATTTDIGWLRPNDPVSIFNPALDSGVIRGYVLEVRMGGKLTPQRSEAFKPALKYRVGGQERSLEVTDSLLHIRDLVVGKAFFLPDGGRAHKDSLARDSIRVELTGLRPEDTLSFRLFAVDSSGNDNSRSMETITERTTDTTRPSTPRFRPPAGVTSNAFTVSWTASRDSAITDAPNFGIDRYILTRFQLRDSGQGVPPADRRDSIIAVTSGNSDSAVFSVGFRFLPPGATFRLAVKAFDKSGFASLEDTVTVATPPIRFGGEDSLLTCPPGFIPMPARRFRVGDSLGVDDETPPKTVFHESFCIEPYEHLSSGRFVTGVTWEEADATCRAISSDDSTKLCSEMEWERACEGFDSVPHPHGIQSETSPAILQTCNQAGGDSAMAFQLAHRNGICLTNEGVFDMAGNLSEWVRDPYAPKSYASLPDTIDHDFSFALAGDTLRGFRGGNFLAPRNQTTTQIQNLARCANRDFAHQVRPHYKDDCKSPLEPQIVIVYGPGLEGFRCQELDDKLRGRKVTDLVPNRADTTNLTLFAFIEGVDEPVPVSIKPDTAFSRLRPTEAFLSRQTLAEVFFVKGNDTIPDTLDATEMRDTSQAALERIFRREAVSPAWSGLKREGRYVINRIYAHSILGSKPAKRYYASRAIGFRCCSHPRPPPPPTTTAGP